VSKRQVRLTQGAWAVLCEENTSLGATVRHENGDADVLIESSALDKVIERQRHYNLPDVSTTICYLYNHRSPPPPSNTGDDQC
jgi:hypothetical protein